MAKHLKLFLVGTALGIILYAISQDRLRVALFLAIIALVWVSRKKAFLSQ